MLEYKEQNTLKSFLMETTGQSAAEKLKTECEKVGLVARNVHIKDTDPGALSQLQVDKLKEKLYG